MKLSIIVPVYNEERTIESLIEKMKSVSLPQGVDKEIIVISDGSTDHTNKILEKYQGDSSIKILTYNQNKGKSFAVQLGIKNSEGDILIIQDADLEYDPRYYPKLIEPILKGQSEMVLGSRFKGKIKNMALINRMANIISNITFYLLYLTKISDVNTCYKVLKKDFINQINFTSKRFAFEAEILAKAVKLGLRIIEVPIDYVARTKKEGKKITWGNALNVYWAIFKYRFQD